MASKKKSLAAKHENNYVAKYAHRFNKATVYANRKKAETTRKEYRKAQQRAKSTGEE